MTGEDIRLQTLEEFLRGSQWWTCRDFLRCPAWCATLEGKEMLSSVGLELLMGEGHKKQFERRIKLFWKQLYFVQQ